MSDAPIHRDTDARICGATTTVAGNSDVFANELLVSVDADPNSHGDGALIAHSNEVYADNILTVNHTPDTANADALCPIPPHCGPDTDQGSPNVYTGDPSKAPTVVIPPVVLAKIEAQVRVHIAVPPPIQPTMTIDQEQQMEIELDDTPDQEETPGEVIARPEDQVWSDICHPHDGILNQHLLESSNDLWDEKGMKLKYHSAINNQHVFKAPNGDPDVNRSYQNEKILHVWDEIGFRNSEVWYTDQTPWCMGYVCYVLKASGYQWFQTATALHADTKRDKFGFVEIPYANWEADAKCGDVCLWKFAKKRGGFAHHVNFLYTNKSQKMSFVGGNQSDEARNNNNPSGGAVTHSWRGTAPSIYNKQGTEGGFGAYNYITRGHDTNLIKIFRPKKVS